MGFLSGLVIGVAIGIALTLFASLLTELIVLAVIAGVGLYFGRKRWSRKSENPDIPSTTKTSL